MQTEITTKVLMTNAELYSLLEKHGFDLVEEYTLNDTYYSSLGGKEKVKEIDYQTLIRSSMVVRKVTESEGIYEECLIYKNKKFDECGNVIGESKVRLKVESCEKLNLLLTSAGFESWCKVVNNSKCYKKGEAEILVQEVENLGTFIEIEEFKSMENLSNEEKFISLIEFVKSLNIVTDSEYSAKKPYLLLHLND